MIYFSTLTNAIKLQSFIIYCELKYLEKKNRRDWSWIHESLTFMSCFQISQLIFWKVYSSPGKALLLFSKAEPFYREWLSKAHWRESQLWLQHTLSSLPSSGPSLLIDFSLPRTFPSTLETSTHFNSSPQILPREGHLKCQYLFQDDLLLLTALTIHF